MNLPMSNRKALLLSIRPQYAEKLFNGIKTVELRKTKPNIKEGDLIYIYVSSPTKALVGVCEVCTVVSAAPDKLWNDISDASGITREQFDDYFANTEVAFGIKIRGIRSFSKPIHLYSLRERWNNFYPPQIYRYLSSDDIGKFDLQLT